MQSCIFMRPCLSALIFFCRFSDAHSLCFCRLFPFSSPFHFAKRRPGCLRVCLSSCFFCLGLLSLSRVGLLPLSAVRQPTFIFSRPCRISRAHFVAIRPSTDEPAPPDISARPARRRPRRRRALSARSVLSRAPRPRYASRARSARSRVFPYRHRARAAPSAPPRASLFRRACASHASFARAACRRPRPRSISVRRAPIARRACRRRSFARPRPTA
jgi:hypothetical protein